MDGAGSAKSPHFDCNLEPPNVGRAALADRFHYITTVTNTQEKSQRASSSTEINFCGSGKLIEVNMGRLAGFGTTPLVCLLDLQDLASGRLARMGYFRGSLGHAGTRITGSLMGREGKERKSSGSRPTNEDLSDGQQSGTVRPSPFNPAHRGDAAWI